MWSVLAFAVAFALPDATGLRPERMLEQTELTVDLGLAGLSSATTRTPTGTLERDHYETITTRLRAEVGITRFLKAELLVPVVDWQRDTTLALSIARFGDPMVGLAAGGPLGSSPLTLAGFAELYFPTASRIELQPNASLTGPTRGVVATTGGASTYLGLFLGLAIERDRLGANVSARGFFRARSNDASNGAGFDVRAIVRVFRSVLVGVRVDGLFPFGGLGQALISASRLSDSAAWVDVSVLLGWRFFRGLDLVAAFAAPAYVQGSGYGLQGQALLCYTYLP